MTVSQCVLQLFGFEILMTCRRRRRWSPMYPQKRLPHANSWTDRCSLLRTALHLICWVKSYGSNWKGLSLYSRGLILPPFESSRLLRADHVYRTGREFRRRVSLESVGSLRLDMAMTEFRGKKTGTTIFNTTWFIVPNTFEN